jgi:hypothetical protein
MHIQYFDGKNISSIELNLTSTRNLYTSGFPVEGGGEGTGASVTGIYSRQLTRQPRPGHTPPSTGTVVQTVSAQLYRQFRVNINRKNLGVNDALLMLKNSTV